MIGEMPMPADFRYRQILRKGRPQHSRTDAFRIRHPSMDTTHRAKIFAPFDALRGFGEAVAAKDVLYERKHELSAEEQAVLDCRLEILQGLTANGRLARANRPRITVTWYVPCSDADSEAWGSGGRYEKLTGICHGVDAEVTQTIRVADRQICIADIRSIESDAGIFASPEEELPDWAEAAAQSQTYE